MGGGWWVLDYWMAGLGLGGLGGLGLLGYWVLGDGTWNLG